MKTYDFQDTSSLVLNSRVKKALLGLTHGYSCNFYIVPNDIWGISDAQTWTNLVLKKGGAPSLDLSNLYHAGVPVSNGGVSSGVVPFANAFDACAASWQKPGKNSAGLLGLDITHPDLQGFLDMPLQKLSKVIYFTEGENVPEASLTAFLAAYNSQTNIFAHKRVSRDWGTNLCTEIKMQHKGTCILSSFNLAKYNNIADVAEDLSYDLTAAATTLCRINETLKELYKDDRAYQFVVDSSPDNDHVGLSMIGLATLLGKLGITYADFVHRKTTDARTLWKHLDYAYYFASVAVKAKFPHIKRAFTQAPTVNSHTYVTDNDLAVSAELSPVTGLRTVVNDDGEMNEYVLQLIVSKEKGNRVLRHAAATETKYDVTPADHQLLFERWQIILNQTGLAQGLSWETYRFGDEEFTRDDFKSWFQSNLVSLYYLRKLPEISDQQNNVKFDNAEIATTSEIDTLFDDFCSVEQNDDDCGCRG